MGIHSVEFYADAVAHVLHIVVSPLRAPDGEDLTFTPRKAVLALDVSLVTQFEG